MKQSRKRIMFLSMILAVLLLVSCATTVTINNLVPSKIDMTSYRNIAVSSTVPYQCKYDFNSIKLQWELKDAFNWNNFSFSGFINTDVPNCTSSTVADYATINLEKTLNSSSYYTVTGHDITDSILKIGSFDGTAKKMFQEKGIDAVVSSQINYMSMNQYYTTVNQEKEIQIDSNGDFMTDTSGNYLYRYFTKIYLNQELTIDISYAITDVNSNALITTKNFVDTNSEKVYVGEVETDESRVTVSDYTETSFFDSDIPSLYKELLDGFKDEIVKQLVPHTEYTVKTLMKNSPKADSVKDAYSLVKKGSTKAALDLFEAEWNNSHHIPSGYNAALLYATLGNNEKAIDLIDHVALYSSDLKVLNTKEELTEMYRQSEIAQNQFKEPETKTDENKVEVFKTIWQN